MVQEICYAQTGDVVAAVAVTFIATTILFACAVADRPWYWSISRLWSRVDRAQYERYREAQSRVIVYLQAGLEYGDAQRRAQSEMSDEAVKMLRSIP